MGRVLRAYDRESLVAVTRRDSASAEVQALDDRTWAETEDAAYRADAEYDTWKRRAEEELSEFEERNRLRALKTPYTLPTTAGIVMLPKRPHLDTPDAPTAKSVVVVDPEDEGDDVELPTLNGGGGGGDGGGVINNNNNNDKEKEDM
jgi:hypothetical protein